MQPPLSSTHSCSHLCHPPIYLLPNACTINGSTTNDCYDDSSQSYMYFTVVFLLTNIGSIGAIVCVAIMRCV